MSVFIKIKETGLHSLDQLTWNYHYIPTFKDVLCCRTWISSGDSRKDKNGISFYNYAINLRGQLDLSELSSTAKSVCTGNTAVCQYKPNQNFARKIAEASSTYVMTGKHSTNIHLIMFETIGSYFLLV